MTDSLERIRKALEAGPKGRDWQTYDYGMLTCSIPGICAQISDKATAEFIAACNPVAIRSLLAREAALREALELYADAGFYHGASFMFDRPTGGFDEDFDYDEDYQRAMPGKRARAALASTEPTKEAR